MTWRPPSPRVAELMRQGVHRVLDAAEITVDDVVSRVDAGTLSVQGAALVSDPALVESLRRGNRANVLHWATCIAGDPNAPVPANTSPEVLSSGRDLVRRGLGESAMQAYRAGQNAAWQAWMEIALDLTDDRATLRELLSYSARSIFDYTDRTIAAVGAVIERERELLAAGTHAQRLETAVLLIDGAPIAADLAITRLSYDVSRDHVAAILWTDDVAQAADALESAEAALATLMHAPLPLSIAASTSARWLWLHSRRAPGLEDLRPLLTAHPGLHVAVGPSAPGPVGFSSSHKAAVEVQRMLVQSSSGRRAATWDAVELAVLASTDRLRARQFADSVLGELATASSELRETLRVYLKQQSNAARAAPLLHAHRNTVLARITRAQEHLPRPLTDNSLEVAVALELDFWN